MQIYACDKHDLLYVFIDKGFLYNYLLSKRWLCFLKALVYLHVHPSVSEQHYSTTYKLIALTSYEGVQGVTVIN